MDETPATIDGAWEYITLTFRLSGDSLSPADDEIVQRMGREGWELVSAFPVSNSGKRSERPARARSPLANGFIAVTALVVLLALFFTFVGAPHANTEIPITQ